MSTASNLVNSFVKSEQAKERATTIEVAGGYFISVHPEMAQMCVERGIGKITKNIIWHI
jgi:hypothetical protein